MTNRISSLRTVRTFASRGTCSNTLLCVINRAFDHPQSDEERASDPLAGGIMQHGYQCGMVWGSVLAAGAEAHRRFGASPQVEAKTILAARRIVDSFGMQNRAVNCKDITGICVSTTPRQMMTYFFLKGGLIGCFRMAARYAPLAWQEINAAFAEGPGNALVGPVSCTAEVARRMGADDAHTMMASGLAGGIGLSGGSCGALGAAIWLAGLDTLRKGGKVEYQSPTARALIERFAQSTGGQFECTAIVGRKFDGTADHVSYLREGGCKKLIALLAEKG